MPASSLVVASKSRRNKLLTPWNEALSNSCMLVSLFITFAGTVP